MLFRKSKKRVLVADDDEDFLNVIRSVLEFAGFAVDTAEDGETALKEIKRHRYDLLILDVVMPRIDGIKLFRMVRKSKRFAGIPTLLVSGTLSTERLEERQSEIIKRAEGYIQKPFKTKEFLDEVRTLVEESRVSLKSS